MHGYYKTQWELDAKGDISFAASKGAAETKLVKANASKKLDI